MYIKFVRLPASNLGFAGFHAFQPSPALPHLQQVGEEWLASRADIADHLHDIWEVYLQLDGAADWHDRGGPTTLSAGQGYLVGPGVRHHLGTVHGVRHHFMFALIDADAWVAERLRPLQPLLERARRRNRLFTGPAEALRAPLRLLIEATTRESSQRDLALTIAIDAVCVAMFTWAVEPQSASLRPETKAVALVRERINTSPGRRWTLAELANGTGLTPKHLCTLFGKQVGQTPHQYLLAARLEAVKRSLVETDLSITQLAEDYGFASSQHLARAFGAKLGQSASAFRGRHRQ